MAFDTTTLPIVQTGTDASLDGIEASSSIDELGAGTTVAIYLAMLTGSGVGLINIEGNLTIPRNQKITHDNSSATSGYTIRVLGGATLNVEGGRTRESRHNFIERIGPFSSGGFNPEHGVNFLGGALNIGSEDSPFTTIVTTRPVGINPDGTGVSGSGPLTGRIRDLLIKNPSAIGSGQLSNIPSFSFRRAEDPTNYATSTLVIDNLTLDGGTLLDSSGGNASGSGMYPQNINLVFGFITVDNGSTLGRNDSINFISFYGNAGNRATVDIALNSAGNNAQLNIFYFQNATARVRVGTRFDRSFDSSKGSFIQDRMCRFTPSVAGQNTSFFIPETEFRISSVGSVVVRDSAFIEHTSWDGKFDTRDGSTGFNVDGGADGRAVNAYDIERNTSDDVFPIRMAMGIIDNTLRGGGNNWRYLQSSGALQISRIRKYT